MNDPTETGLAQTAPDETASDENESRHLLRRIRVILVFFIIGLVLSGLTAFPLRPEVELLARWLGAADTASPTQYGGLLAWIVRVREALRATDAQFPFLAYGTDWLAFAHLVIAVSFIGPYRDPVRNIWILEFGLIACLAILPVVFICGALRGIPYGWQLIDCSFGVVGFIPLWLCRRYTLQLAQADRRWNTPAPSYLC